MFSILGKTKSHSKQFELQTERLTEPDRNHRYGGRSFYFFDFDDNIMTLPTETFLYHKETGAPVGVSSSEYTTIRTEIGRAGPWEKYQINFDAEKGTYQNFRDQNLSWYRKYILRQEQAFVQEIREITRKPLEEWCGPSWNCFYHAVLNKRPIAVITARGHSPKTLKRGLNELVRSGALPHKPNILALYPVSYPKIRDVLLEGSIETPISVLKKRAIRAAVMKAFKVYGHNPFHRFGMSDDDPDNIRLVEDEMLIMKKEFPQTGFFIIEAMGGAIKKREVIIEVQTQNDAAPMSQTSFSLDL